MDSLTLHQYQVVTESGQTVELEYDQEADMLEIFFQKGPASGAIELAEPMILRFDRETGKALSLSVLTFSKVIEETELGPRSFHLSGIDSLPDELRKMVSQMITSPPMNSFLNVSAYHPRVEQPPVAISYLKRTVALPLAA